MTLPITIDARDVATAADFLEQFLTDQVPDGDFSRGTALRDLTVQALAVVTTFLRADAAQIRQMQSLLTVQKATQGDPEALKDAVTAILSNVFIKPKAGIKARGYVIGHATQLTDILVAPTTKFTYTRGIVFVVDAPTSYVIPQAELIPIVEANGAVLEYEFRIPVVAVAAGPAYNVTPGLFVAFDRFNPYVTRIESTTTFAGGKGAETVDEVLARAPTAIAVRNLVNARSIEATLADNFDGIETTLVVGMADPEMQRDIVPTMAPHLRFHVGGAVDIYLRTPLTETVFTGPVGGVYARPDGVAAIFKDAGVDFTGVLPGDILRLTAGVPRVPSEYLVEEVLDSHTLRIAAEVPFAVVTDEALPPQQVAYTIGTSGPLYNDRVAGPGGTPHMTGVTSRRVATSGRVTLPGGPVMDILDVALVEVPGAEGALRSPLDGFIHFTRHVNTVPANTATLLSGLEYQVVCHNQAYAQSMLQHLEVVVGTDAAPARFDGYNLRVRYRTAQAFPAIDAFVRGRRERISAAFQLPRAHHPVVVGCTVAYVLRADAPASLDNTQVAQTVIDYIDAFDATSGPLDVSALLQLVKNTYPTIANIVPSQPNQPILQLTYALRAPTGALLSYLTTDVVTVDAIKQVAGPALELSALGVTTRTLRYLANTETVKAVQVVAP